MSGKEAFILVLFFLLLLYSVISFLKSWNKNYRDINHLPFYTMCEEKNSIAPGEAVLELKKYDNIYYNFCRGVELGGGGKLRPGEGFEQM